MKNAATGWHNAQSLFKWIPGEKVKDLREQSSGMQTQKLPMSHLCKPMTQPRCSHSKKCFCSWQMRSKQNATLRIWNKCGVAYTGLLCREGILVRPWQKKKKKGKWWHGIKSTILCVWERFTGNTWNSSYVCLPIPKEAQQRKQTQNGGGYCLPSYFSAACGNEYMGHSEQCPWLYSPGFCMLCDGYLQEGLTKES